jgi:ABC-type lipoprotein export system ATPase subunit
VLEKAKSREIPAVDPLPVGVDEAIEEVWRAFETQATNLENAAKADARKQMVLRHGELAARLRFKEHLPSILKTIDLIALNAKLASTANQTNTNAITRKSTELTEAAIASGLNTALDTELKALNVIGLKLEIGLRGQKGQGMQKLRLNMAKPLGKAKVSDVLSEGEQRAIAIACFLAETNLVSEKTAIVFDDPVSSVDHYRRELIATRLATEAKKRQVIIFTHELSFAWDLTEAAKKAGANCSACRVYPTSSNKGVVAAGLPHEGGKIIARINALDTLATKAKKTLEEDNNPEQYELLVRDGYRKLRDAWERLIEECLFGDAVRRFRNSVQTTRLRLAEIEDQDVVAVDHGMTRCSMFTHDAPTEAPPILPQPGDFVTDIAHLRTTHARIEARMKITEERRKPNTT